MLVGSIPKLSKNFMFVDGWENRVFVTFPGHLVQAQCLQSPNQCRRTNCVHSILLTKDGEARVERVTTKMRDYWIVTDFGYKCLSSNPVKFSRVHCEMDGPLCCVLYKILLSAMDNGAWLGFAHKMVSLSVSLDLRKMILASLVSNLLANDGWVCPSCDTLQFDKHHYCSLGSLLLLDFCTLALF